MGVVVEASDKVKEWLAEKGKPFMVEAVEGGGCCAGGAVGFMTRPGKPDDPEDFELTYVNDIPIYLEKNLDKRTKDGKIELKVIGFSIFKTLQATGNASPF